MEGRTFREWMADRVGDDDGRVSRRELARRLAERDPRNGNAETHRRSVRRILNGDVEPSQPTRDAIQDALGDHSAPRADDADAPISREEIRVWLRVNRKLVTRATAA